MNSLEVSAEKYFLGGPSGSAGGVFGVISGHKTISIGAILTKPFFLSLYEPFVGFSPNFVPVGSAGGVFGTFREIKPFLLERF